MTTPHTLEATYFVHHVCARLQFPQLRKLVCQPDFQSNLFCYRDKQLGLTTYSRHGDENGYWIKPSKMRSKMILTVLFERTLWAKNIVAETVVAPLPPEATCQLVKNKVGSKKLINIWIYNNKKCLDRGATKLDMRWSQIWHAIIQMRSDNWQHQRNQPDLRMTNF